MILSCYDGDDWSCCCFFLYFGYYLGGVNIGMSRLCTIPDSIGSSLYALPEGWATENGLREKRKKGEWGEDIGNKPKYSRFVT
ncbi:unnamed protein product [Phytomonas sp. EM1]|nr:unnamed protein product [Phytomonas sp. EM1]|eukprot:CCW64243.1 unnamed protein product [Phytomonas sp. isolate EM1]